MIRKMLWSVLKATKGSARQVSEIMRKNIELSQ